MRFQVQDGEVVEDVSQQAKANQPIQEPMVVLNRQPDGTVMFQPIFPKGWSGTLEMTATPNHTVADQQPLDPARINLP